MKFLFLIGAAAASAMAAPNDSLLGITLVPEKTELRSARPCRSFCC